MSNLALTEQQMALLQELIYARGPAGEEGEVAALCRRELEAVCDEVWTDPTGNVISLLRGEKSADAAGPVRRHCQSKFG